MNILIFNTKQYIAKDVISNATLPFNSTTVIHDHYIECDYENMNIESKINRVKYENIDNIISYVEANNINIVLCGLASLESNVVNELKNKCLFIEFRKKKEAIEIISKFSKHYTTDTIEQINNQIECEIENECITYNNGQHNIDTYPVLFHKYLLGLRNISETKIEYDIINVTKNLKNNNFWAHLHCFDLSQFNDMYLEYIDKIEDKFKIIVTFFKEDKNVIDFLKHKNYIVIKSNNHGIDIGVKFMVVDFLKKNKCVYDYVLFLHSKKDEDRRKLYFKPLIDGINMFSNMIDKDKNIGLFVPPLILDGDFYHVLDVNINLSNIQQPGRWSKHNLEYMNDLEKYYGTNVNNLFPEGNCYIMKHELINILFSDIKIYGVLNSTNSFDYSWVKNYYGIKSNNIFEVYNTYVKNKLFGNNLETGLGHAGLADCMIEHAFERLVFKLSKLINLKIEILPILFNNRICRLFSNYINGNSRINPTTYLKSIYGKTLTIIASHTNNELKKKTIMNNIKYLKNISDKIIIVDSKECSNIEYENLVIKNNPDILIDFFYTDNTVFLCEKKWLDIYKTDSNISNEYNNFILTNDSFVLTRDIYDFEKLFINDIEETTILASNESFYHHTDFLRRYNKNGFVKIMNYIDEQIKITADKSVFTNDVIYNFEMLSHKFFSKTNYLYFENDPVNIHFIEPYTQKYLEELNYPIIKLKRLQCANYKVCPVNYDKNPFNPETYKMMHSDLHHLSNTQLKTHFEAYGIKEGRKYYVDQEIIIPEHINVKIVDIFV